MTEIDVPTVEEIDQWRQESGLSMRQFSRRAGFDKDRWRDIVRHDYDLRVSTLRAFCDVLEDDTAACATPGRKPDVLGECRSDGGAVQLREGESPDRIAHLHGNERLKRENEVGEYARGEDR